jgi:hypothetical protein
MGTLIREIELDWEADSLPSHDARPEIVDSTTNVTPRITFDLMEALFDKIISVRRDAKPEKCRAKKGEASR